MIQGQYWRLLTYAFLHGDLMHLLFNMLWLGTIGPMIEEAYGKSKFILLYVLLSIGAGLVSHFSRYGHNNSVGASGAILGLIGVMIAYGFRNKTSMGDAMKSMGIRWAVYGVVFGFIMPGNVDNAAHIGGVVCGFVLGYLISDAVPARPGPIVMWRWLNYASWVAIVGSILLVGITGARG